jgi:hypothetical protein
MGSPLAQSVAALNSNDSAGFRATLPDYRHRARLFEAMQRNRRTKMVNIKNSYYYSIA